MVFIRGTRILKDGGVSISSYDKTVESRYDGKLIITYCTEYRKSNSWCFSFATFKYWLILLFLSIALIALVTLFVDWTITTIFNAFFSMYTILALFPIWLCLQFHNGNKYHAALHMVKNAYKALQRIPTVEECKKFSFYDGDCTLTFFLVFFMCYILSFAFSFIPIDNSTLLYPFLCLSFTMLSLVIILKWKLDKYLVRPFLAKPTDIELTVVIECLSLLEQPNEKTICIVFPHSFDA